MDDWDERELLHLQDCLIENLDTAVREARRSLTTSTKKPALPCSPNLDSDAPAQLVTEASTVLVSLVSNVTLGSAEWMLMMANDGMPIHAVSSVWPVSDSIGVVCHSVNLLPVAQPRCQVSMHTTDATPNCIHPLQ
jgi:hypothetical protein